MGRKRKVHCGEEDSDALEAMIHFSSSPKKMKKVTDLAVRRSGRLNSSIFHKLHRPALEHVNHVVTENNACQVTENADTNGMEATNTENTCFQLSNNLPPKKANSKYANVVIRRSNRLKNSVKRNPRIRQKGLPVRNKRNMEKVAPNVEQITSVPIVNDRDVNVEEVEGIARSADKVKSKAGRRRNEGSSADLNYRSLYFDSQKAMDALMEKHLEVVKKSEYANGKIDAYEKMYMMVLMWLKPPAAAEEDDQNAASASKKKKKATCGKC